MTMLCHAGVGQGPRDRHSHCHQQVCGGGGGGGCVGPYACGARPQHCSWSTRAPLCPLPPAAVPSPQRPRACLSGIWQRARRQLRWWVHAGAPCSNLQARNAARRVSAQHRRMACSQQHTCPSLSTPRPRDCFPTCAPAPLHACAQGLWFWACMLALALVMLGAGVPARPVLPQGLDYALLAAIVVVLFM